MQTVNAIKSIEDIAKIKMVLGGRDLLLFTFGLNSSLRIGDILSLKVGDVRGKEILIMKEQKTSKRKEISLNKAIKEVVKELIPADADDTNWLFPSKRTPSKPLDRIQAWRILNSAADRANINLKIGTHTLRKTWAYHRYAAGIDLAMIQKALNHSSQRETLRYIGIEQEQINDLYDEINL